MNLRHALDLLYEDGVIPLFQWVLKTFPVEKLVENVTDERLKTNLGGVELPNPVILSSHYYDTKILEKAMKLGFGAVTTKTITVKPRPGNPKVTVIRKGNGLVNCNGLRNPGMEAYEEALKSMRKTKPLIVSVTGETSEEYGLLVRSLSPYADLIEINISCPNVESIYSFSSNPEKAIEVFRRAREATDKPIIAKLSPDFEDSNYRFIIPAAIENEVRIINFGNTRRVKEPRLSQGFGGYSGPNLFDNVMSNIRRIRSEFGSDVQIIATGGIDSPEKAYKALTYADAISYFTTFTSMKWLLFPEGLFLASRINRYLLDLKDVDPLNLPII